MSYRVNIGYYLDTYDTLLPADSSIPTIKDSLWYVYLKGKFNDEVWANFYDRELFDNRKFNHDNEQENYDNIVKTIKIRLINRQRIYERMFNAFTADFNPLWNVDGVTGTIRESTHTGTDTSSHTGTDTTTGTGGHTNVKTGSVDYDYTGKETTDYKGTETDTKSGSETHTKGGTSTVEQSNTTFDSSTYNPVTKTVTTPLDTDTLGFTNRQDTKTFTGRQDEKSFTNRKDSEKYNSVTDTYTMQDESHETEYDSELQKTLNLLDKDLEMVIRQGNIGVTRSDELITHALELFDSALYDFVRYVTNDLISQVTYSIY